VAHAVQVEDSLALLLQLFDGAPRRRFLVVQPLVGWSSQMSKTTALKIFLVRRARLDVRQVFGEGPLELLFWRLTWPSCNPS